MLDREAIKEFLLAELEDIEIPKDISIQDLVETFCKFVEDDYYEWLKDNFDLSQFFKTSKNIDGSTQIKVRSNIGARIRYFLFDNLNQ